MADSRFRIPAFRTQSGDTLDLELAYSVFGSLNEARDNVIVFPTYYGGRTAQNRYLIGSGRALDPEHYCIVVPNLFGNGVSTSPSNAPESIAASRFPKLTYHDNVACQRRLLREVLKVERVKLAVGYSMGAMQAWEWAAQAPDSVENFAAICGSSRCYEHNQLFLDGVCAALRADAAFADGEYEAPPVRGLEAFSIVYAGWFASQKFYSEQVYRDLGLGTAADMVEVAKRVFMDQDANNLLAMASTWRAGDISANAQFAGDLEAAIGSITARGLLMPCDSDLYFRLSDNEKEVALLAAGTLAPIRSEFGHLAGGGSDPAAVDFIDARLRELLTG